MNRPSGPGWSRVWRLNPWTCRWSAEPPIPRRSGENLACKIWLYKRWKFRQRVFRRSKRNGRSKRPFFAFTAGYTRQLGNRKWPMLGFSFQNDAIAINWTELAEDRER